MAIPKQLERDEQCFQDGIDSYRFYFPRCQFPKFPALRHQALLGVGISAQPGPALPLCSRTAWEQHCHLQRQMIIGGWYDGANAQLVGGWATPLKNMSSSILMGK